MTRRHHLALAMIALAATPLAACSSSATPKTNGTSSQAVSTPSGSVVAPTTSADLTSAPAPTVATSAAASTPADATPTAAPTQADLAAPLTAVIDPSTPPATKVTKILGGSDLVPTLNRLQTAVNKLGPRNITFTITSIVVTGSAARGSVDIKNAGQSVGKLYTGFWRFTTDGWEVTRAGVCSIVPASGVVCDPARG